MASANINVSGLWKNVKQIYSNVGGTWQSIKSGWVNVGGLWKQFFSSGAYSDSGTTVSSTYSSYNSVFTPYITGTTSHWQNAVSLDYRIQKDPGSGFTTVAGPYTFTNPGVGSTYTSSIGYTVQANDFTSGATVFRFLVTALDSGGTQYTESADITINSTPQLITTPTISVNSIGTFTAGTGSWTAGPTSYTYDFQYSTTGSSYSSVQNSSSNTYAAGTTFGYYRVVVTATNGFGSGVPASSSSIHYDTNPTDPGITVVANADATLTFTATYGANTDWVYLEYDTSTAYLNVTTISPNGGSYTTPVLNPDTLYYYRAKGYNSTLGIFSTPGTTGTKRTLALPGLVPTFSGPSALANGFYFNITNYSSSYTWSATSTSGSASVVYDIVYGGWIVKVTGLSASATATATVTVSRTGYTTTVTTTPTGYAGPATPTGTLVAGTTTSSGYLYAASTGADHLTIDLYRSSTSGGSLINILSGYYMAGSSGSVIISSVSPYINGYYSGWVYAYNGHGDMIASYISETYVYTGPPSNGTVSISSSGTGNFAVGETITVSGGGYYGNPTTVYVALQRSLDNSTWSTFQTAANVVGQSYTSTSYVITNTDAAPPPFYYRGISYATNANSTSATISTASYVSTGYVAPFSFTPFSFTPTSFSFTPFSFTPTAFSFTPFSFTPFAFNRFNFTGSCVHEDTLIRTLNGYIKAKELKINDKVLSLDIDELPDNGPNGEVQYDYTTWESPTITSPGGLVETTIVDMRQRIVDGTIYFNNDNTKLFSLAHPMFVYSNNKYEIKPTSLVELGDYLVSIGQNGEIINTLVEFISTIDGEQVVYQFDMEPQDWYISGDMLGHNK